MKKLLYFTGLIILFSVSFSACQKDNQNKGTIYTPYTDIVNPPDTFLIYYSVRNGSQLSGNIQFKTDAVWTITQLPGTPLLAWFNRTDKTAPYEFTNTLTIGLQGNIPYSLVVKNTTSADVANVYMQFIKTNQSYSSFSTQY